MIKVVSFKICPFVQRVTALLEAKKVPYDIEYISLKDKPQWFLDISPNAQVPLLITESGSALFESDAIVEYIDEVYPTVEDNVTPEQRALDRAWSYQASKHYLVQCSTMRSPDKATLKERAEKLSKVFEKAEKALTDGPYFKGNALSNVDIAWLPLLHRADIIRKRTCYDFVGHFPKVKAWQQAMMEIGLAEKSVPEDFVEAFSHFYLSDETFLGKGADSCVPDESSCSTAQTSCCP